MLDTRWAATGFDRSDNEEERIAQAYLGSLGNHPAREVSDLCCK